MSRQDANAAFARTSFLYGGNAAYIEDLYARYEHDPASVDAEWRDFFQSLKDERADVARARGPSWQKPNWPIRARRRTDRRARRRLGRAPRRRVGDKIQAKAQANGVELSAADVQQATRDSIHALMLIRAYRMRGHFHANLDPLGLEPRAGRGRARSRDPTASPKPTSTAGSSSTTCSASSSRRCARSSRSCGAPTARRSASSSCTSPNAAQKAWIQERIEGRDKEITFTREGKRAILNKLVEAEGFEKFLDVKYHRHQALRPRRRRGADPGAGADHQARRRARREGDRHRHAAPRPAERARRR